MGGVKSLWDLAHKSGIGRVKEQDVHAPNYSEESQGMRIVAARLFEPLPKKGQTSFNEAERFCHPGSEQLVRRRLIGVALQFPE
jgi:hypothetical protein